MITNNRSLHAARMTLAAAVVLATATAANAADYEFRVTKAPSTGTVSTIELIDTATGRVIPGAKIDVVQTVIRLQQKGVPNVQRTFIPLQTYLSRQPADSNGRQPADGELTLMATVPGEFWPVWRDVNLSN